MSTGLGQYVPDYLLREHGTLAIYVHCLRAVEPTTQKVLWRGNVTDLESYEFCVDFDAMSVAIGICRSEVKSGLEKLAALGLLRLRSDGNRCKLLVHGAPEEYQLTSDTEGLKPPREYTLEAFTVDYCAFVEANFAKKTLEIARRVLKYFIAFAGNKGMDELTAEDLEKYKQSRKVDLKDVSINIDVRTLKAAMEKAVQWGKLDNNPFEKVQQIRVNKQSTKFFTSEKFTLLLDSIKEPWLKDIVRFGVLTGLRRGEICDLKWVDYDDATNALTVQSTDHYRVKGGKMRTIILHPKAQEILKGLDRASEWVFINSKGRPFHGDHVSKKLKRYIRSAGLPENLHFHSLRHTFGTWGANAGIPSNVLKEMMGHSSIKTTEVYMGVDSKAMGDQVGKITLPG